ncbi:MAG: 8-oxo-dGTP diphosphatase [Psychromonas sp.]|jgi:8-oxo-dGTP diphosphatase|uniref:NUDIX domain-containing protein n=1 Tax=Psychromonas sp. TaxID=1884585 RepID=UPI0039E6D7DA
MNYLSSVNNQYGGTYVAPEDLPANSAAFEAQLTESLKIWHIQEIKVVWIKIPNARAKLLPFLYQAGFMNHHCAVDFMMLTLRLEDGAMIPPFANHSIGVGGLVINENNQLLTIREKDHIKTHPHNWKFPGGMLEPYEHIEHGVIREVLEETSVQTEFQSFIGFRHHHQGQFNTSNIYAVCLLKPLTLEITIQESEIFDAKWFPIEDYLTDHKIGKYNQNMLRSALQHSGLKNLNVPGYMPSDQDYEVFMTQ